MTKSQAGPFLSVVIPAYNERQRIASTLDAVTAYLVQQSYDWNVTVVDDGSCDDTSAVVTKCSAQESRIHLLPYSPNRGKGHAVRYGMQRVTGAWRLFMDADNATSIDHLESMLPLLDEQISDVIIGSRKISGARTIVSQPWWKESLGNLGGLLIRILVLPGIEDSQAGFKVFRSDVVERIFPLLTIDRWAFDVELLAVAKHFGYRIHEHPIRWFDDKNTKVKLMSYPEALLDVLRIRRRLKKRGLPDTPDP